MRKSSFFIILLLVFNGLCFAQSTGNETRIIGSWQDAFAEDSMPDTWVFNGNGTMTINGIPGKYVIAGNKLAIKISMERLTIFGVFDYQISTDGKTLILIKQSGYNVGDEFCLTKR